MTTLTTTKLERLSYTLDSYKKNYEAAKAKFVEKVELNPNNAITWADGMVAAQAKYEAAYPLIELGDGEELTVEAVEHLVAYLAKQVRYSHGTSTSGFSNAVENCAWGAKISVLEDLESWLKYASQA